jgi:hypothetical protein
MMRLDSGLEKKMVVKLVPRQTLDEIGEKNKELESSFKKLLIYAAKNNRLNVIKSIDEYLEIHPKLLGRKKYFVAKAFEMFRQQLLDAALVGNKQTRVRIIMAQSAYRTVDMFPSELEIAKTIKDLRVAMLLEFNSK